MPNFKLRDENGRNIRVSTLIEVINISRTHLLRAIRREKYTTTFSTLRLLYSEIVNISAFLLGELINQGRSISSAILYNCEDDKWNIFEIILGRTFGVMHFFSIAAIKKKQQETLFFSLSPILYCTSLIAPILETSCENLRHLCYRNMLKKRHQWNTAENILTNSRTYE